MSHVITSPCEGVCDTACVEVCPIDDCIIGPLPIETLRATRPTGVQLFIDPDECIDCGACLPECPVEAIYVDDDVPERYRADIERNAAFFRDR